jgi:hydroxymethylglutaryl-CoA reductase (NADPH)
MDSPSYASVSPTLGMRLDAFIQQLDSLSSTQLYGIIVGFITIGTFLLLGSGDHPEELQMQLAAVTQTKGSKVKAAPEPQWHIFRWVNYLAVAVFGWSVADFSMHAAKYLNDSDSSVLLKFLLGWSVLLCYFFGFFGVSFVHDIAEEHRGEEFTAENTNANIQGVKTNGNKKVHPPADCAPVCSDPASLKTTNNAKVPMNVKELTDMEVAELVISNAIKDHELEKRLDPHRAVVVRRIVMEKKLSSVGHSGALEKLPFEHDLDYSRVFGANCEIVVGYVPLPVGMVGPMTLNGETVYVPMATTEGCLVASTNRGAKAITQGGGAFAEVIRDGITRAPCIRMTSARDAAALKLWCEEPDNFKTLKSAFESTTSFGKLKSCSPTVAGKNVYLRLQCFSGDAMGMNMVSKGSLAVIETLKAQFPSLQLVALSGNMCTDKKAAATNWIEGRGKSVVVEATIPKDVVRTTLKTTVKAIVETNLHKNLIGSAMAGTIGGFNAHASNIVTAVFLATGQDPAQNVESSNCITLLEEDKNGDLWISCTMPSLEVGTVGGGTSLPAQAACLEVIGFKGGGTLAGSNSQQLAKVVAAATMAGELSLLAALAANTLVAAHMQHNRKPQVSSN